MSYNLAELFEAVAVADPGREILVVGDRRLTYAELEERANRLAHVLRAAGIGPGDTVGLQLANGSEYIEAMLAAFKLRAVPVNINYRYVERELRYLYDDAELSALVVHRSFAPRAAPVLTEHPMKLVLDVDDGSDEQPVPGSIPYEAALSEATATRPETEGRSSDDLYLIYTGGTTGM
ncbi:MAG: AMP-binding protein, partial [Mycobacteriales bacterium]